MYQFFNLKELLLYSAHKYNNKILYQLNNITYSEFLNQVNYLGTALFHVGLNNKRIAIISENRYEWELAYFAIVSGVGTVVPIDKSLPSGEIKRIITRANIDVVFCSHTYQAELLDIQKNGYDLLKIISFDDKEFIELLNQGEKLIEEGNNSFINAQIDNNSANFIVFTSGTSDNSKAVMLSHKNICTNIQNVAEVFELSNQDVVLAFLQLNHVLEGIFGFLLSIYKGATRIHCNNIEDVVPMIQKYKITFMCGVPFVYERIYPQISKMKDDFKQINMFMCGGAVLDREIERKYRALGIHLVQGYGMTETSPVICIENKKIYKEGSVGKVIPNVEIKIHHKDENGIGEILVKGENIALGYYDNKTQNNMTIEDGWLHTGDLGKVDEDGFVFISGRLKNMIALKNGKKVYPEELEDLINQIDGIEDTLVYLDKENAEYKICADIVYDKNQFLHLEKNKISKILEEEIEKVNRILPKFKTIRKINILNNMERNSMGKLKRAK